MFVGEKGENGAGMLIRDALYTLLCKFKEEGYGMCGTYGLEALKEDMDREVCDLLALKIYREAEKTGLTTMKQINYYGIAFDYTPDGLIWYDYDASVILEVLDDGSGWEDWELYGFESCPTNQLDAARIVLCSYIERNYGLVYMFLEKLLADNTNKGKNGEEDKVETK